MNLKYNNFRNTPMSFETKMLLYDQSKKDTLNTWLLFLVFGWSYGCFESYTKQIMYYLTGGLFGIWTLYICFTLNSKIKEYNLKVADIIGFDGEELSMLGLF